MNVFQMAPTGRIVLGRAQPLLQALATPGQPFRIGGAGPILAGFAEFETLTSGSSGKPRLIRRTMQSWIHSFAVNAALFGIGPGTRVAVLGAMEQSLSLYGAVEALHLGADLYSLCSLRPDRQWRALSDGNIEVLYATPAQLRLIVEAGRGGLPALRVIVVGGSKVDAALRAGLLAMAPGADLREFYGTAESSFISLACSEDPPGSVGRAYPGVEIRLKGPLGEVWVRSPYLFLAYAGDDPGSARWEDGWLSVGEMGRMDTGLLFLSGRAGRMVTVADQNVFPEEIEDFLMGLPGVRRCAVLPKPDPLRGVHLVAVVEGQRAAQDSLQAALRAHLGPLKCPKSFLWLEEWPILASGKTDLVALADMVRQ